MTTDAHLRKAMGLGDLVLFYVVTALSLRWIATAAAAGPSSIVIWIVGCVTYFVPLTFCVLELSSRYPEEGGIYLWSKKAFGEFAGFMTGQTLYLDGMRLDESYPVSIPVDYLALNITITGYRDQLGFGYTACRTSVPALQRMLAYTDESLAELEAAL